MTSPKTFMTFAGVLGLILAIPALAGTPKPGSSADLSMPSKMAMPSAGGTTGTGSPAADATAMPSVPSSPATTPSGTTTDPMGSGSPSPTSTTDPMGSGSPSPTSTTDPMGSGSPSPTSTTDPMGGGSPSPSMNTEPNSSPSPSSSGPKKPKKSSAKTVDINTASLTELQTVKGIGAATAKKILAARPYKSLDDLVTKKALTAAQLKTLKPNLKY